MEYTRDYNRTCGKKKHMKEEPVMRECPMCYKIFEQCCNVQILCGKQSCKKMWSKLRRNGMSAEQIIAYSIAEKNKNCMIEGDAQ